MERFKAYTKDFSETDGYLELVKTSDARKQELFSDDGSLTYYQLRKRIKRLNLDYELHHRVPRYRLKNAPKDLLIDGANLLVLTPYEHILAHYYLASFEEGRWYYSATMAFIQITSLKREMIETLQFSEIQPLLEQVAKSRSTYFGSKTHRENSRESGKRVGEIRRIRMQNDPEFAEYIKSRLLSPEARARGAKTMSETVSAMPFWERPGAKKPSAEGQLWEYSQLVFLGVKTGASYKKIANYAKIEKFNRIANVVRILRDEFKDLDSFNDWRFYNQFVETYPNYKQYNEEHFNLYCTAPWSHTDSWVHIDKIFQRFPPPREDITESDLYKMTNVNSRKSIVKWLTSDQIKNLEDIEDWPHYPLWLEYKDGFEGHVPWRPSCLFCEK